MQACHSKVWIQYYLYVCKVQHSLERKLDVEAKFTYHLMSVLYYKKKNLMWGGGEGCGNKLLGNEVNLVLKVISFR